jgi:AcrR family transcriptional regulator
MENKEIQEQRMKEYFIRATQEMLKGEGLKSISVRKVADRAGYSYATLYNYFKDIHELIFLCVKDFQNECREMVESGSAELEPGMGRILVRSELYIRYFVEYPGIFELFYLERMTDVELKQPVSSLIYPFLTRLCQEDWDFLVSSGQMDAVEAEARQTALNYLVTGMLLHYINRRQPVAYSGFLATSNAQLERILR